MESDPISRESMRDVLNRLGIKAVNAKDYQTQLGLSLRAPKAVEISGGVHALLAPETVEFNTINPVPAEHVFDDRMQVLLTKAKTALGLNEGDYTMFFADQPNDLPHNPPMVIVAKADSTQQKTKKTEHVLGVCQVVEQVGGARIVLDPISQANEYFAMGRKLPPISSMPKIARDAKITILQQPKHGRLERMAPDEIWLSDYVPNIDYLGNDTVTMQVEGNGYRVKIKYFFEVVVADPLLIPESPICKKTEGYGFTWKISSLPTDPISLASLQRSNDLATILASASNALTNFTNLPGTAVGETVGAGSSATITLDTNAVGHGWFIDATPGNNSEYLPTSDANVWIAKAGSAAEGKMDMLSVLLHEYGHALGFEHSADTSDFMAASLVAGERRLPTADELTHMSQLIAKLKGSDGSDSPSSPSSPSAPSSPFDPSAPLGGSLGLLALGRLRRNDYGGWGLALDSVKTIAPQASTQYQAQYQAAQVQAAQYEGAINPTLTNGSFASDNNSTNTNTPANWRVSGNMVG